MVKGFWKLTEFQARINERDKYYIRLENMLDREPENLEDQAHWAKYICVLINGYLEQSIRELILEYVFIHTNNVTLQYIDKSWPRPLNLRCRPFGKFLEKFNKVWSIEFRRWLDENDQYEKELDAIVSSRNNIAHGKEANATNVTLPFVKKKLMVANELVKFLELQVSNVD